jgi:hypothetical protein
MPNKISLADLVDPSTFPNKVLAKLLVGKSDAVDPVFMLLLLLPYIIGRWILFPILDEHPELRPRLPQLLGEDGRISQPKLEELFVQSVRETMERLVRERTQKNSPVAMHLLEYANQADPPAALVDSIDAELQRTTLGLRWLVGDLEDFLQTAHLLLIEELQPLRSSPEKLVEAFLTGNCNYTLRNVRYRIIDHGRRSFAQKRRPTALINVEGLRQLEGREGTHLLRDPSPTPEEVVADSDLAEHVLRLVAQEFPGKPRKLEICKYLLKDNRLSSAELANLIRCSKKTVDRDLAELGKCCRLGLFLRRKRFSR